MPSSDGQPNILWIQFDEIRADSLSCYKDNPWIRPETPNVQRLAERGVVFENAFCNSPVCMPSRGSELTSQHPTTLGVYHNVTKRLRGKLDFDCSWLTWPRVLRDHGYRAVNVGKSHVVAYDVWDESIGCPQFPNPQQLRNEMRQELDLVIVPGIDLIVGGTYPLEGGDYDSFMPRRLTRMGLDKLDELHASGAPWLLRMSYVAPHTPVLAPPPFDSIYPESRFAAEVAGDSPHAMMSRYERSVVETQQSGTMSPHEIARARATYYGLVAAMDREVGLLLDKVSGSRFAPTIIVITGDHGAMLGEMGLWQKQIFNRKVHQVPLVISGAGVEPGRRTENVDLMDLGPTLLRLCGAPIPERYLGRDLFGGGLVHKDIFGAFGFGDRGAFMYEALARGPNCPRRICIRSGAYRLDLSILQDGRPLPEEDQDVFFCDAERDPVERSNAAHDPRYASIVAELREKLLDWYRRTAAVERNARVTKWAF